MERQYFQYLYDDNILVPRSTIKRRKRKLKQNEAVISNEEKKSDTLSSPVLFNVEDIRSEESGAIHEQTLENENDEDNNINDFSNSNFLTSETNKEELCAAALTFFFTGKMTQSHLSFGLKFFNLTSSIKIPLTFDALLKNITNNHNKVIEAQKIYFCFNCKQEIKIDSRYQRSCITCQSK